MNSVRATATRQVVTKGVHAGEGGSVGYKWGESETAPADLSAITHGRIQGYIEPCEIEILTPGAEVRPNKTGDALFLYVPGDNYPYDADEAIEFGHARPVPPVVAPLVTEVVAAICDHVEATS